MRGGQPGDRRAGVVWHTQGSGKSFSMVFFAQKVLRKITGNWSFVVVTDRVELDDQIAGLHAYLKTLPPAKELGHWHWPAAPASARSIRVTTLSRPYSLMKAPMRGPCSLPSSTS